ncbi:MAG: DUF5106 domain-containing protein [Prevotella sp.]|nr:DUF5106 domain-containing protein [Prevotella sp.]
MKLRHIILTVGLLASTMASAQQEEVRFPFPAIPEVMTEPQARLEFLLEHYWSVFNFEDSTATNRATAEQGFVDYINLLQYADSAVQAGSVRIFADSIARKAHRQKQFDELIDHYLGNPDSPMRNDVTYAHLLRVLPTTPQRTFLLREVTKNQPGTTAADLPLGKAASGCVVYTSEDEPEPRLYYVESPTTLLVFYDPNCEHCQEMMPQIRQMMERDFASRTCAIYINVEENTAARKFYYLPALPALYLLDSEKTVIIKDGNLQQIENYLRR